MKKNKALITEPPEYIPLLFMQNGKEMGRIVFENNSVVFKGNAQESAKIWFECFKKLVDEYIKDKLKN